MIEKFTTAGGITVLLEPIEGVVSISAGLWVKTGSRHEGPGEHGYAHFIEHMLFKGTENYSARDIARLVDRVGGQHNAATNREYTCYYINVISDHLALTVELLADMYYRSLFEKGEIDKERNVIIEEIRMYEDTPDELVHDHFIEAILADHPLGHSIIGDIDSITNVDRKKLVDFFSDYYLNKNCLFVIAGKFDIDEAKRLIEKRFSAGRPGTERKTAGNGAAKRLLRRHVQRDLEQVHVCIGAEGVNKNDKDRWALYALSTLLGGSMSSRLFQNIREKEGLCYSIYSFHSSYMDRGIFGIYCGTAPENFERIIDLVLRECGEIVEKGVSEEELLDTKAYIKGNIALSMESTEVRMGQLARNEMNYGRYVPFEEIVENINKVTRADIDRITRRLLTGGDLTLVSIGNLDEAGIKKEIRLL